MAALRDLGRRVGQPLSLREVLPDLAPPVFSARLDKLVDNAEMDATIVASMRHIATEDTRRLFRYAYEGKDVDF